MPLGQTTELIKAPELDSASSNSNSVYGDKNIQSPSLKSPLKSPNKPAELVESVASESDGWETEHIETVNSDSPEIEEAKGGLPKEENKDGQAKEESKIEIFENHIKKIESITGQKADETDKKIIDTFK